MKTTSKVGISAACGLLVATCASVALASPSDAACKQEWVWFGTNPSNSTKFYASSGCDGVWAGGDNQGTSHSDQVRGWYYKSGAWHTSSYGWQFVSDTTRKKIVGNTVVNRKLRGEAYSVGNSFWTEY